MSLKLSARHVLNWRLGTSLGLLLSLYKNDITRGYFALRVKIRYVYMKYYKPRYIKNFICLIRGGFYVVLST